MDIRQAVESAGPLWRRCVGYSGLSSVFCKACVSQASWLVDLIKRMQRFDCFLPASGGGQNDRIAVCRRPRKFMRQGVTFLLHCCTLRMVAVNLCLLQPLYGSKDCLVQPTTTLGHMGAIAGGDGGRNIVPSPQTNSHVLLLSREALSLFSTSLMYRKGTMDQSAGIHMHTEIQTLKRFLSSFSISSVEGTGPCSQG